MLSRVANSLYWINRYVERAENIARFVEVSEALCLDSTTDNAETWLPIIDASGDRDLFDSNYSQASPGDVTKFLIKDKNNSNSILQCLFIARENARQIRDVITTEMWEQLNCLFWSLQDEELIWKAPTQEQLREIRRGCQLFYGITDVTLSRDLSWQFSQLGRLIERADKTSRILDVKYFLLLPKSELVGGVLDELQWIALLKSAGAYQMFRQAEQQPISPIAVARYLLLDPNFPRSIRYCLDNISKILQRINNYPFYSPPDDLECLRGNLLAKWSYVRINTLIQKGLHEAIDELQQDLNLLHNLIEERYFITNSPQTRSQTQKCKQN